MDSLVSPLIAKLLSNNRVPSDKEGGVGKQITPEFAKKGSCPIEVTDVDAYLLVLD